MYIVSDSWGLAFTLAAGLRGNGCGRWQRLCPWAVLLPVRSPPTPPPAAASQIDTGGNVYNEFVDKDGKVRV